MSDQLAIPSSVVDQLITTFRAIRSIIPEFNRVKSRVSRLENEVKQLQGSGGADAED